MASRLAAGLILAAGLVKAGAAVESVNAPSVSAAPAARPGFVDGLTK